MSKKDKAMKYSAVIVLAHQMDKQGNLNSETSSRLRVAVEAFRLKETDLIVTCGWPYRSDSKIAIADAMRDYALKFYNIPDGAIIADVQSRDTVGDAIFTKRNLAIPRRWKKLLIVTSQYHVPRTMEIFSFIYGSDFIIEVRGAQVIEAEEHKTSELKSIEAFRNTFAGICAGDDEVIFNRLIEAHPFYNGTVYPRIDGL